MNLTTVFLSYSHQDRELAERLAKDLKTHNIGVWLDEWEILVGDSITQQVTHGLNQVDFVTLLLTNHSVDSGWVEKEWQSQIGIEAERKRIRILPVRSDCAEIPVLLRDKKYADISSNYEKGLSDLVRAIKGHAERNAATIPTPPASNTPLTSNTPSTSKIAPSKTSRKWKLSRLITALIVFLILVTAGIAVYIYKIGRKPATVYSFDGNNTNEIFAPRATIVPPAESYKIREVLQLPKLDYSSFEMLEDRRVMDFRGWQPFKPDSPARTSPVTWSRRIRLKKVRQTDDVRFGFSTEGSGIDPECISGQDYYIETATVPSDPPQLLLKGFHVVVNVARYALGEEFEIKIQATIWNGSRDLEDWSAQKIHTPVKVVSMLMLFPDHKPFKWKKNIMYIEGNSTEQPPPEHQRNVIYTPDNRALYWEIKQPIPGNTYEIQFGW